jgi:hypothetical protein
MPDSVHTSFKDLVGVVRRSPPMLIALGVVVLVIAFIVYKRSQSGTPNTVAASNDMTGQPGYFLIYNESATPAININDQDSSTHPGPMPPPVPPDVSGKFRRPDPNPNEPLYSGRPPKGTNYALGSVLTLGGKKWIVGPGNAGRIWGVPYRAGLTNAQWNATPIGIGQKQLLYR